MQRVLLHCCRRITETVEPTCCFIPAPSWLAGHCAVAADGAVTGVGLRRRLRGCLAVLLTDEDGHQVGAVRPELLQRLLGQRGGHQHRLPPARTPPTCGHKLAVRALIPYIKVAAALLTLLQGCDHFILMMTTGLQCKQRVPCRSHATSRLAVCK